MARCRFYVTSGLDCDLGILCGCLDAATVAVKTNCMIVYDYILGEA